MALPAAGIGMMALALAGGLRAKRDREIADLRRRQQDDERAFKEAAQRQTQTYQQRQMEQMDATAERDRQKFAFDQQKEQTDALQRARANFLEPTKAFEKDDEVSMATAPQRGSLAGFVDSSPEMLDPKHPMSGVLEAQKQSDLAAMKETADPIFKARADAEAKKADSMGVRGKVAEMNYERIPPADRREIVGYENTMRKMEGLKGSIEGLGKNGQFPGLYNMKINQALPLFQAQDVDTTLLKARTTEALASYIYQVSGKAVTEQEFKRLERILVNDQDTVQTAVGKIEQFNKLMREKKFDALEGLRLAGHRVPQEYYERDYSPMPGAKSAGPKPLLSPSSDDGKDGRVLPSGRKIQTRKVQ